MLHNMFVYAMMFAMGASGIAAVIGMLIFIFGPIATFSGNLPFYQKAMDALWFMAIGAAIFVGGLVGMAFTTPIVFPGM